MDPYFDCVPCEYMGLIVGLNIFDDVLVAGLPIGKFECVVQMNAVSF